MPCTDSLSVLAPDLLKDICDHLKCLEKAVRKPMTVSESAGFADLTEDLQNLVLESFEDQRKAAWQEIQAIDAEMEQLQRKNRELDRILDLDEERDPDALLQQKSSLDLRLIDLKLKYEHKKKAYAKDFSPGKLEVLQEMMTKDAGKIKQSSAANLECPTCAHTAPVGRDLIDERVQQSEGFMDLPPDIRRRLYSEAGAMRTQEREDTERKIKRCVDALWRYGNVIFEYRFYFPHMKAERRMVQRKQTELYRDVQRAIQRYEAKYNRRYPEELTFPEDIEDIQPSAAFVVEESKSWLPALVTFKRVPNTHADLSKTVSNTVHDRPSYRAGLAELSALYLLGLHRKLTVREAIYQQIFFILLELSAPRLITASNVSNVNIIYSYSDKEYTESENDEAIKQKIYYRDDGQDNFTFEIPHNKAHHFVLSNGRLDRIKLEETIRQTINMMYDKLFQTGGLAEKRIHKMIDECINRDHLKTIKAIFHFINTAACLRIYEAARNEGSNNEEKDQSHVVPIKFMVDLLNNAASKMKRDIKVTGKIEMDAVNDMLSRATTLNDKLNAIWLFRGTKKYEKKRRPSSDRREIGRTVLITDHFAFKTIEMSSISRDDMMREECAFVMSIDESTKQESEVGVLHFVPSISLTDGIVEAQVENIQLPHNPGNFATFKEMFAQTTRGVNHPFRFKEQLAKNIFLINALLKDPDLIEKVTECVYNSENSILSPRNPFSFSSLLDKKTCGEYLAKIHAMYQKGSMSIQYWPAKFSCPGESPETGEAGAPLSTDTAAEHSSEATDNGGEISGEAGAPLSTDTAAGNSFEATDKGGDISVEAGAPLSTDTAAGHSPKDTNKGRENSEEALAQPQSQQSLNRDATEFVPGGSVENTEYPSFHGGGAPALPYQQMFLSNYIPPFPFHFYNGDMQLFFHHQQIYLMNPFLYEMHQSIYMQNSEMFDGDPNAIHNFEFPPF